MVIMPDFQKSLEELVDVCYGVRKQFPTLPVLGIQWMHHTNMREGVHQAILSGSVPSGTLLLLAKWLWLTIKGFFLFLELFWLRLKSRKQLKFFRKNSFNFLAKSWIVNKENKVQDRDFYLGDLQSTLLKRGQKLLLLLGSADGSIRSYSGDFCLSEYCLVSPFRVFYVYWLQLVSCFSLRRLAHKEKQQLVYHVLRKASIDVLNFQTMLNCLYYWVGKNGVRWWQSRAFITLYEGYAWEKCLWSGVKAANLSCKTIGYQHTVILQRTYALRKPNPNLQETATPDIVLCSGHLTTELIKNTHKRRGTKVIPFGSFRYEGLDSDGVVPKPAQRKVLVTADGILPEAIFLFNVALKTANLLKDHQFIFRCHPALPFDRVAPFLKENPAVIPNVEVSRNTPMNEDLSKSSVILYRGSSCVLYAILKGLKPVYFHQEKGEVVDPIFELEDWREFAVSEVDLSKKIFDFSQEPFQKTLVSWRKALDYVQSYTMPVGSETIQACFGRL